MRRHIAVLFAVLLLSLLSFPLGAETYDEANARFTRELAAKDAAAVAIWNEANAARDAERYDDAARLYGRVVERVPTFVHALRRQAYVEHRAGRTAEALQRIRQAVQLERSADNLATEAAILVESKGDLEQARTLAEEAANLATRDEYVQNVLAVVASASEDLELLRTATIRLESISPKSPQTHTMRVVVALNDRNYDEAYAALDRARSSGLPQNDYDELAGFIEASKPFYVRWWKPAVIALAAWFGGFALMLLAGALLSRSAMRAAKTLDGMSSRVKRLYKIVLSASCVFYYASIPIVIASVLAFSGGLIYASFALGHVPIKIVLILVVLAGVSVWSMLKSLFIRRSDEDPGMRLDLAAEPKLRALLDDVAAKIGTRAVDNVYITPSTEIAVMERGGRQKERCLILGVAALEGMKTRPFKAILGHEYGHFLNEDTAGGAYALRVRSSLAVTAVGLAQGGVATWYNPAWWFVNGFHRLFLRISEGASRLQEVLADRWAVAVYGAEAFEAGLRHVVERGARFDAHVGVTLKEVVERQVPLANLYTYAPQETPQDVSAAIEESLSCKSSPYDSHPAPAERFELVHALPKNELAREADDELPATELFANFEALQFQMTAQVRDNVRANTGVEIAAPAPAAT